VTLAPSQDKPCRQNDDTAKTVSEKTRFSPVSYHFTIAGPWWKVLCQDSQLYRFLSSVSVNPSSLLPEVLDKEIKEIIYFYYVYAFLLLCMFYAVYSVLIVPTGTIRLP
jgi:hypothetical protein